MVERVQGRAVASRDRKVERVARAKSERVLICVPCGCPKMSGGDRQNGEALASQPIEHGESGGPLVRRDLSCA